MNSDGEDEEEITTDEVADDQHLPKNWARTRTLSINSPSEPHKTARKVPSLAAVPEELTLDYAEISAVPPLPLWLLLAADQGSGNLGDANTTSGVDSLFNPTLDADVSVLREISVILWNSLS